MYAEKDNSGKTIIQDLNDFDVDILIKCLSDSLVFEPNIDHFSINRKKIILKSLEDVKNGKTDN